MTDILNLLLNTNNPEPKQNAFVMEVRCLFGRDVFLSLCKENGLKISPNVYNSPIGSIITLGLQEFTNDAYDVHNAEPNYELKMILIKAVGVDNFTTTDNPFKAVSLLEKYVNSKKQDNNNIEVIVISCEQPKKKDVIVVHENIVRINHNLYKIYEDVTGKEFIVVDNTIRKVKRTIFGDRLE